MYVDSAVLISDKVGDVSSRFRVGLGHDPPEAARHLLSAVLDSKMKGEIMTSGISVVKTITLSNALAVVLVSLAVVEASDPI
jgi:hypothetical protein